ncbi:SDR family oxidoreductase [Candidatus Pelagibacter sp.]|nr:SDR family oxidoreductase [Candidatus Pelagibacter sp.]
MKIKILIIGASGMVGNAFLRYFSDNKKYSVAGTVRNINSLKKIVNKNSHIIFEGINANKQKSFLSVFEKFKPNIVINCIGSIKQKNDEYNSTEFIKLNSLFPHYLAELSTKFKARFIHLSTDCVFSGLKGNYKETDFPDALDLYGRSKLLGEIKNVNALTLRTSVIGNELNSSKSLLSWFLSQNKSIKGYKKAIFSGFTSNEYARIISEFIIPNDKLNGLFHISSEPINKYDLLNLIKKIYKKDIDIKLDDNISINRSLNSSLFRKHTGFKPKPWELMIKEMEEFK